MDPSASRESLLADQRRRWEAGDHAPAESYFERYPALADDPEAALDLIYGEVVLREEAGESPDPAEYLARFPRFANELRLQFDVHRAIEDPSLPDTSVHQEASLTDGPPAPRGAVPPESVPGYEIQGELGRGGMGVVYLAVQKGLKRRVALKMILAGGHAGAQELARFRTEAEAAARLVHPNIVQVYEVGEAAGRPYLALELVEGGSLAQHLTGTPQPPRDAARLIAPLARAMGYAHRHGVVHRDLKPANILIQRTEDRGQRTEKADSLLSSVLCPLSSGIPKISDFGLAKLLDSEAGPTATEALLGTPNYMAPEQAAGRSKQIGPAADVYSLGAILYECLTGRPPFRGATAIDTLEQVRSQEAVPPRRMQPKVPADLETVCLKCLEKQPHHRYASADDLADDLERFLVGDPVLARPVPLWRRAARWARQHPRSAALTAAGLAAVPLLLALLALHEADLQVKVRRAEDQVESHYAEQRALEEARETYQRFVKLRDEAVFLGIAGLYESLRGGDAGADPGAAAAARQALAVVGVAEGQPGPPAVSQQLSPEQQRTVVDPDELAADCAQLSLLLSGGAAPADPGTAAPVTALDYFLRGDGRLRRGDVPGAAEDFARALRLQPGHFWAQLYLAFCQLNLRRPDEAWVGLTACLARRPDFRGAYLLRGVALGQRHDFAAAEADFGRVLKIDTANPDEQFALYVHRGEMRAEAGRTAEAVIDLKRAMALRPHNFQAPFSLARVYQKAHNPQEALRQIDLALKLDPPAAARPRLLTLRAELQLNAGDPAGAVRTCDEVLRLRPDDPQVHGVRGKALLDLQDYAGAERSLTVRIERGEPPLDNYLKWRGLCRVQLGNAAGAVDDYTRALGRAADADLLTHRGWAYFFGDAWKLALADFDRAVRLAPVAADAHVGRGLARVMLGQYREAVADADEALRLKPDTPLMLHNLACVYAQAAARAEADRGAPEAGTRAEQYRTQAVDVLRQALTRLAPGERGPFWQNVLADSALDPIRATAAYKRLEADFPRPSGAAAKPP